MSRRPEIAWWHLLIICPAPVHTSSPGIWLPLGALCLAPNHSHLLSGSVSLILALFSRSLPSSGGTHTLLPISISISISPFISAPRSPYICACECIAAASATSPPLSRHFFVFWQADYWSKSDSIGLQSSSLKDNSTLLWIRSYFYSSGHRVCQFWHTVLMEVIEEEHKTIRQVVYKSAV